MGGDGALKCYKHLKSHTNFHRLPVPLEVAFETHLFCMWNAAVVVGLRSFPALLFFLRGQIEHETLL